MATDVVMPQMGESIAEGTIVRWIKKVGDKVDRDEPLFEISTDKVDAEIPSPAATKRGLKPDTTATNRRAERRPKRRSASGRHRWCARSRRSTTSTSRGSMGPVSPAASPKTTSSAISGRKGR